MRAAARFGTGFGLGFITVVGAVGLFGITFEANSFGQRQPTKSLIQRPSRILRPTSRTFVGWRPLVFGVVLGAMVGVMFTQFAGISTWTGIVAASAGAGLGIASSVGAEITGSDISASVLARDRRAAIVAGLVLTLMVGIPVAVISGRWIGIAAGAGMGMSFGAAAWPSYSVARIWLALWRRLPWRLMSFLADAHKRGVLRQAGAVYQFRHTELQHRLAAPELDSTGAS